MSISLVVNCYERTYRNVLAPGYFPAICGSNRRNFDEIVALINNVADVEDAKSRAESLRATGEISSYSFVADHITAALRNARLSARALRRRPYLIDYGLVMPHVASTDWLLGWDAETRLRTPANWVDPAIELMGSDPRIFHASLSWPPTGPDDPGVAGETVETSGRYALNWGFSDQLFLIRRADLAAPIYRSFAPAAMVRHAPHPYTFEYRVEGHQRAVRRFRATSLDCSYITDYSVGGVIERTGRSRLDAAQFRALRWFEHHIVNRLPESAGPRFRKA